MSPADFRPKTAASESVTAIIGMTDSGLKSCACMIADKQTMRTVGLLTAVLLILLTGATQERNFDADGNPEVQFGAQVYKDQHSGIILYVESDARHISAISRAGKLLWTRDPFKDAHLEFYRTKHPQVADLGPAPKRVWIKGNAGCPIHRAFCARWVG
jgi:hypothetical protein